MENSTLWRKLSTDDYYIVCNRYGVLSIEGTQNKDRIQELYTKIVNSTSYKGYSKVHDPSDLFIMKNTHELYSKIINKHIFTDETHK